MKNKKKQILRIANKLGWINYTNKEFAKILKVSSPTILKYRKLYAPHTCKKYLPKVTWVNIDWKNTTNIEINKKYNVSLSRIYVKRKQFAPETMKSYKLKHIDWTTTSDENICNILNISLHYVQFKRRILAPETRKLFPFKCKTKHDWKNLDYHLYDNQTLADKIGCNYMLIHKYRKRYAPETRISRKLWKPKVKQLIAGDIPYVTVSKYNTEQSAIRVSAYKQDTSLTSQMISNGKYNMYINKKNNKNIRKKYNAVSTKS